MTAARVSHTHCPPGRFAAFSRLLRPTEARSIFKTAQDDSHVLSIHAPVLLSDPTALPETATIGQLITFSSFATDDFGDSLSYAWSFSDASAGDQATVTHAFASAGLYTATVTVSDGRGGSVKGSVVVTIVEAELRDRH